MSFSFDFYARDKVAAAGLIGQLTVPDAVKAYASDALANLPADVPVYVRGNGHLCSSPSYPFSNADVTVKAFSFAEYTPTAAVEEAASDPVADQTDTQSTDQAGAQAAS